MDFEPLWLTFKLASLTTLILFGLALPMAYWLAYGTFRGRALVEAVIGMPLVLPPSVLGFYLLLAFSPSYAFGAWIEATLGLRPVGEFGVVLMIGGNIPGVTKVASVAIYNEVEALDYSAANQYALVLFVITFIVLLVVYSINNRLFRVRYPS